MIDNIMPVVDPIDSTLYCLDLPASMNSTCELIEQFVSITATCSDGNTPIQYMGDDIDNADVSFEIYPEIQSPSFVLDNNCNYSFLPVCPGDMFDFVGPEIMPGTNSLTGSNQFGCVSPVSIELGNCDIICPTLVTPPSQVCPTEEMVTFCVEFEAGLDLSLIHI